ncbi:MAG: hypothetical protein VR64_11205 [Desulfatitalea sp. BRH_c12]|nr:MAG: hypothetical protein VR64_11205 [Desulfatitalea sp. BRH_c12]
MLVWSYRCLRWMLGITFIYSGVTKLLAPETFAVLIEAFGLVPEALLLPAAVILPVVEVVAGAGLLVDLRGSLAVITGLLLLFVALLGYGIHLGLDVDCGCFGPEDPEADAFHGLKWGLYRDLAMLAAIAYLYAWRIYDRVTPIRVTWLINKRLTYLNFRDWHE